jgi:hypothetical protein
MFHDGRAEHQELRLVPAAHDVERETPIRDMIDGGGLFGRHDRMDCRHVRRRKDGHLPRGRRQPGGPGVRLEAGAVEVGLAPKAPALSIWSSLCQELSSRDVLSILIRSALWRFLLGTARMFLISR